MSQVRSLSTEYGNVGKQECMSVHGVAKLGCMHHLRSGYVTAVNVCVLFILCNIERHQKWTTMKL